MKNERTSEMTRGGENEARKVESKQTNEEGKEERKEESGSVESRS
jgi:hypothetical protein